jgi:hypothetical protein
MPIVPPPGNGLVSAGAVWAQELSNITALEGVTPNCLAAIPTVAQSVPWAVVISIGGVSTVWTLRSGSDTDDPANGVVRPNDFDPVSNAKVFYQSNL